MNSNIGRMGKDKVTGLEGIITARCEYLYGCNQLHIQPVAKENRPTEGLWIDEGRVVVGDIAIKPEEVMGNRPGGPSQGPTQGSLRV